MNISLHVTNSKVSASVSGFDKHTITDEEIKIFGITDGALKKIVGKQLGKNPDDVMPTTKGDQWGLHKKYSWPVVTSNVTFKNAEVLEFTSKLGAMSDKIFTNNSSVEATFGGTLNMDVQQTTTSTWSNSTKVALGTKVNFTIGVPLVASGGAEISTSFETITGKTTTKSETVRIGDSQSISLPLKPGEAVKAQLMATTVTVKLRVHYYVSLEGQVACNYNPTWDGHHFWAVGIEGALAGSGMPSHFVQYEDIEMIYYGESHTDLINWTV